MSTASALAVAIVTEVSQTHPISKCVRPCPECNRHCAAERHRTQVDPVVRPVERHTCAHTTGCAAHQRRVHAAHLVA